MRKVDKRSKEQQRIADRQVKQLKYDKLINKRYNVAGRFNELLTLLLRGDPYHVINLDIGDSLEHHIDKLTKRRK